jgi:hypothetical protein
MKVFVKKPQIYFGWSNPSENTTYAAKKCWENNVMLNGV